MPLNTDLGQLILNLNPYTNRDVPYSDPLRKVGEMDIYCDDPVSGKSTPDVSQIAVEADGPYRQEWKRGCGSLDLESSGLSAA